MAILYRTISELTIGGMSAQLTAYVGGSRMRVEIAPYNSAGTAYTGALNVQVTYNGGTETLTASPFSASVSAMFSYVNEVKSVTLSSSAGISYHGTTSVTQTISWKAEAGVPSPTVRISQYSGLMVGQTSRIEWEVDGVPDGYTAYVVGVWCYSGKNGVSPTYARTEVIGEKSTARVCEHTVPGLGIGIIAYYRIAVGVYENSAEETAGREDYAAYAEVESPGYLCKGIDIYTLAPYNVRYSGVSRNRMVTVRWDMLPYETHYKGFDIQCSHDSNSAWTAVYHGPLEPDAGGTYSFTYTLNSGWTRFRFRLTGYVGTDRYEYSSYVYGKWQEIGQSNVYVGRNGIVTPAQEIWIGDHRADAVMHVG